MLGLGLGLGLSGLDYITDYYDVNCDTDNDRDRYA